jgi:uncharacterized protein
MKQIIQLAKYILLFLLFFIYGCSSIVSYSEQYINVNKFVSEDNFTDAVTAFEKSKEEYFDEKDRLLYWIDLGLLNHYVLQDSAALINLNLADFAIEELYTKSISKGVASMVLNDNALDYSGEDFENIYINVFKALSFYRQGRNESALVEIRRLLEKFVIMEQKYQDEISFLKDSEDIQTNITELSTNFYSSALAHYLSMILFYNDASYDDARISKEKLYEAFDTQEILYDFPKPNLEKLLRPSAKSKISFLTFTGNAPLKHEYIFKLDTFKNLVIITVQDGDDWKDYSTIPWYGVSGGLHAKFAVPEMVKSGSYIKNIEIYIDGNYKTDLYKLESIENIAFETFKRDRAITFLKSLARTITKAISNEAINNELDKETGGGGWGELTRFISGAIINSTENADLRSSHYFPGFAYGGDIEIKPGIHTIEVVYVDNDNKIIAKDLFENYRVYESDRINLIETVFLQ